MSDDSFIDLRHADGRSRSRLRSVAAGADTVFAPFQLRFRPFIAGIDRRKTPSRRALGAQPLANAD